MSYGFELVRLGRGVDRDQAYEEILKRQQRPLSEDPGPIDPSKEEAKQRLAAALMARHRSLELFQPDYSYIGQTRGISQSEARRQFRNLELNEPRLSIQILLFDDAAGASFAFSGGPEECVTALHLLWDCLEILESQGGFAVYDPQIAKVLDLNTDFNRVLKFACGVDRTSVSRG